MGAPRVIVVMGVSGSGKSTVGRLLADRLGWRFLDADDFHPPANVRKMASGQPLEDEDRWPWLDILRQQIDRRVEESDGAVLACSALRRVYRERLGLDRGDVALVHLDGSRELLMSRLTARAGHFMPAALLDSQLETLEAPGEEALWLDIAEEPEVLVERVVDELGLRLQ